MKLLAIVAVLLFLVGCTSTGSLPPQQSDVTSIKIERTDTSAFYREIYDEQQIMDVINWVNQQTSGWTTTSANDENTAFVLKFYKDERFVGNFYVLGQQFGRDYGAPYVKDASEQDILQFQAILGLDLSQVNRGKRCSVEQRRQLTEIVEQGQHAEQEINAGQFGRQLARVTSVCQVEIENKRYKMHFTSKQGGQYYLEQIENELNRLYFGPFG